jgi:hypothetical protein
MGRSWPTPRLSRWWRNWTAGRAGRTARRGLGSSQAVTGRALRADDDELLHLAVPVLAALRRDKAA